MNLPNDLKDKAFIYGIGLVYCSVCVPKDWEPSKVENTVNAERPTGISSSWRLSKGCFKSGLSNPCSCNEDADRVHYLLSC